MIGARQCGRLHDLERGRQLAIKPGHRRAPSLECPQTSGRSICDRIASRGSYEGALSVIAIILPSEKSSQCCWKLSQMPKSAVLIDLGPLPVRNSAARRPTMHLSPEIYPLSGLVGGLILQAGFDD